MRWWVRLVVAGLVAFGALWLIANGLDDDSGAPPAVPPTTTTTSTSTTSTTLAVAPEGERPADALAEGAEHQVRRVDAFDGIHLDILDVVVIAAIALVAVWWIVPSRAVNRPVSVTVVDGSGDGEEKARNPKGPAAEPEAIAALVRDRLARVDLRPPSSVPSVEDDVGGLISVVEAVEPVKGVGAVGRALARWNPRRRRGYEARLVMRRSDNTPRAGITVELYDLDGRSALSVTTVWDTTFESAARRAAFQLAAVLLRRLPRSARRDIWWRWDVGGDSLRAFEDAAFELRQRRYDAAIRYLDEGLAADPSNLAIRLRLGQTQERLKMYPEALWTYQRVINPTYPLDPRDRSTREAGLIRWRASIVMANANLWVDAWVSDVLSPKKTGHETTKRLKAFFVDTYGQRLDREFSTIHQTLLAEVDVRRTPIVATSGSPLPALRLPFEYRVARLRGDGDVTSTFGALRERIGDHTILGGDRDALLMALHRRVQAAASGRDDPDLDLAAPAVSVIHYVWRAAHVEAARLDGRSRKLAGLSRVDLAAFHLGTNVRRLEELPIDRRAKWELRRQQFVVDALLRSNSALAWLRLTTARRARPQACYNAACARAIEIPQPPAEGTDAMNTWKKEHDGALVRIIQLLAASCLGEHNLVEGGAADWIVFDDPDLDRIRRHPEFCRFAKSVLHREIDSKPPADPTQQYVCDVERAAVEAATALWRRTIAAPPSAGDLAAQLEKEAELHRVLGLVLTTPESSTQRELAGRALRGLDASVAAAVPGWPQRSDPTRQLDRGTARLLAARHAAAAVESRAALDTLREHLDRAPLTVPGLGWISERRLRLICRRRLDAWRAIAARLPGDL